MIKILPPEKGRVEPISIEVKAGRSGLGVDSENKRKIKQLDLWRAKRKKESETRATSFQSRMSDKYTEKSAERDLRTAQKACLQLDQQQVRTFSSNFSLTAIFKCMYFQFI